MVGAHGAAGHWDSAGAAYVFKSKDGAWSQQAKLIAHDGMSGDHFGWSVGIYYSHIVVGASAEEGKGQTSYTGGTYPGGQQPQSNSTEPPVVVEQPYIEEENEKRRMSLQEGPGQGGQHDEGHNCGPNSDADCNQFEGKYLYRGASAVMLQT